MMIGRMETHSKGDTDMAKRIRNIILGITGFAFALSLGVGVATWKEEDVWATETENTGIEAYDLSLSTTNCTDMEIYFTMPVNDIVVTDYVNWTTVLLGCNEDGTESGAISVIVDGRASQGYITKVDDTMYYFDFYGNSGQTVRATVGTTLVIDGYFHLDGTTTPVLQFNTTEFVCTAVSTESAGTYGQDGPTKYYATWEQVEKPQVDVTYKGEDCGAVLCVESNVSVDQLVATSADGAVSVSYPANAVQDGKFVKENGVAFSEYTVTYTVTKANGVSYTIDKILRVGYEDFMMRKGAAVRLVEGSNGLRFAADFSAETKELFGDDVTYGMIIVPRDYLTSGYELNYENFFGANKRFSHTGETGKKAFINMEGLTPSLSEDGTYAIYGSITDILEKNITREFVGCGYVVDASGNYTFARYYNDELDHNARSMYYVAQRSIEADEYVDELQDLYVDTYKNYLTENGKTYYVDYQVNHVLLGEKTITTTYRAELNSTVTVEPEEFAGYQALSGEGISKTIYANKANEFTFYYESIVDTVGIEAFAIPKLDASNNYHNDYNEKVASDLVAAGVNTIIYAGAGTGGVTTQNEVDNLKALIRYMHTYGIDTIVEMKGVYFSAEELGADSFFPDFSDCVNEGFKGLFVWDEPYYGAHDYGTGSVDAFPIIKSYVAKFNEIYGAYDDVRFFTNLNPSYNTNNPWGELGSFVKYLDYYGSEILSGLTNTTHRVMAVDTYPIQADGSLNTAFLSDLANVKMYAEKYNATAKVGLQASGWVEGNDYQNRMPTEEELRMQAYAALAFGMDEFYWFTCAQQASLNQDGTMVPVQADGTLNDSAYNAFLAVNNEIAAIAELYAQYDWKGVNYRVPSWWNGQYKAFNALNTAIKNYNSSEYQIDASETIFSTISSSQTYVMGAFEKDGENAYTFVNYSAPSDGTTAKITLKTTSDVPVTIYRNGGQEVVTITSAGYTLQLAAGEGVFMTTEQVAQYNVTLKNADRASAQVYEGALPADAQRDDGYVFAGWYYEDGTRCYGVSEDCTLVAAWKCDSYKKANTANLVVVKDAANAVASGLGVESQGGYPSVFAMTGNENNTYSFTLPKIDFNLYSEVSFITVFGQGNTGYTFKAYGTTFVNTSTYWNWGKVIYVGAEGKTVKDTDTGADIVLGEGYYLTFGNTDVGEEWYKYVKLASSVVNGEKGLTFSVTLADGAWDWMAIRESVSNPSNNILGIQVKEKSLLNVYNITTVVDGVEYVVEAVEGSLPAGAVKRGYDFWYWSYEDGTKCNAVRNGTERLYANWKVFEEESAAETVVEGVIAQLDTELDKESQGGYTSVLVLKGNENNTYKITLPKIKYALYSDVSFITVFGGGNSSYAFSAYGTTFANISTAWNFGKVIYVGASGKTVKDTDTGADIVLGEGYYLTFGNTDIAEEWYKYVRLPNGVINGETGATFSVTLADGNWDWMAIRASGGVAGDNILGNRVYNPEALQICNVTTVVNGEENVVQVLEGKLPENPVRGGYVFTYWTYADGMQCLGVADGDVLYARWQMENYVSIANPTTETVVANAATSLESGLGIQSFGEYSAAFVLTGVSAVDGGYSYTFTLPAINFNVYSEVSFITVFGQQSGTYGFSAYGTNFANISAVWNWGKVIYVGAEGKTVKDTDTGADITLDEGYYLTFGNVDVGEEWYKYVKLSDAVVNGKECLTFAVTTPHSWDWMAIRESGASTANNIVGTRSFAVELTVVYNVTTVVNGEESVVEVTEDSLPEMPVRDGYVGYWAYADGTQCVGVTADGVLYPRWQIEDYLPIESTTETVVENAATSVESGLGIEAQGEYSAAFVLTGNGDKTYTFTLPAINFNVYSEVSFITAFGQQSGTYGFSAYGTNFANIGVAWNWGKVIYVDAAGKAVKDTDTGADIVLDEGYYLTFGNVDVGEEWYKYVKLSDAVVNGEEGLTFAVTTPFEWDWMAIRESGASNANNIVGTRAFALGRLNVYNVTTVVNGVASVVEVVEGGLPAAAPASGKVQFVGWAYEDGTTCAAVTADCKLYAKWQGYVAIETTTETVVANATTSVKSGLATQVINEYSSALVLTGASAVDGGYSYTFTLPAINFNVYSEVSFITVFGQQSGTYGFSAYGTNFANISAVWNWGKVIYVGAEGKTVKDTDTGADITLGEGYYLTFGDVNVGEEWYKYEKLSDAVINGEEGLTFTVVTPHSWDWMAIRESGASTANNIVGTHAFEWREWIA